MTRLLRTRILFASLACSSMLAACSGGKPADQAATSAATDTANPHAGMAMPAESGAAAVPAAATPSTAPGVDAYAVCQTCHQANGEGLPNAFPPLAGSAIVNGPVGPHVAIVLKGMSGPITVKGATYNNIMAPWESLSDEQIVSAINYERASWGNTGTPVTAADVARVRAAVKGRSTPWTVAELEKAAIK
ncbi:MAG: cytochrome c [Gemmatimonadales bacterium]